MGSKGYRREEVEIVKFGVGPVVRYGSPFPLFALATALSSLPIREISSRNNATATRGHGVRYN